MFRRLKNFFCFPEVLLVETFETESKLAASKKKHSSSESSFLFEIKIFSLLRQASFEGLRSIFLSPSLPFSIIARLRVCGDFFSGRDDDLFIFVDMSFLLAGFETNGITLCFSKFSGGGFANGIPIGKYGISVTKKKLCST